MNVILFYSEPYRLLGTFCTDAGMRQHAQNLGHNWVGSHPASAASEATRPVRQPPLRPEEFLELDDRIGIT